MCPGTKISGGPASTAAAAVANLALPSSYGKALWACTRLGAPKALTAMAHLLLRITYKPVTEGLEYHDSIYAKVESEHQQNRLNRLQATAKKLGFDLVRTFNPLAQSETLTS